MPLNIAIDFDETFAAIPSLFAPFIESLKKAGHQPWLVTARRQTEENWNEINAALQHWECDMPIVFTELGSKRHVMEARGVAIDIWIDDSPEVIINGM